MDQKIEELQIRLPLPSSSKIESATSASTRRSKEIECDEEDNSIFEVQMYLEAPTLLPGDGI
jgi:hypothetical protein